MKPAIVTFSLLVVVATLSQAANGPADGPRVCITNVNTNRKFPIHVKLNGKVGEVKETLHKMGAISPGKLELKFKGQSLDDKQTLEHYNVVRHSDLVLKAIDKQIDFDNTYKITRKPENEQSSSPITLFFFNSKTIPFSLDVNLTDTIAEVKEKIYKQEEFPVEKQRLLTVRDGPLEDPRTIESYKLVTRESIELQAPVTWCIYKARLESQL